MQKYYRTHSRKDLLKILIFHVAVVFSVGGLFLPSPAAAHPVEEAPLREVQPGEMIFPEVIPSTMIPDLAYTVRTSYVGQKMTLEYPNNLSQQKHTVYSKYRGMNSADSFAIAENASHPYSGSLYLPALQGPVKFQLGTVMLEVMVVEITPDYIRYYRFR